MAKIKVLIVDDCDPVRASIKGMLQKIGFEILEDASLKLIESIKKLILEKVQNLDIDEDFLLSKYLSEKLNKEYSSISKVFSQTENITLEQYFILQNYTSRSAFFFFGRIVFCVTI